MAAIATISSKFAQQLRRRAFPGALAFVLAIGSGCDTTPTRDAESPQAVDQAAGGSAESFYIVDCLLPGQVRQLGGNFNYLTQRRPIKTSQSDCEIRGGEYVAFDRADYSTALGIWLPLAKTGDASAQTYVGEIYEKGLGLSADYALAAHWYGEAVKQGYSRAQINLGNLYEKGLGVPQDKQRALNLYRSASGLADDHLLYASTLSTSYVPIQQHQSVQRQLDSEQQRSDGLRNQLSRADSNLQQQSAALKTTEAALLATQVELEQVIDSGSDTSARPTSAQEVKLFSNVQSMDTYRADLEQQLAQLQAQNNQLSSSQQALVEELSGNERDKNTYQTRVTQLEKELSASREQVAQSEQELANITSKVAAQPSPDNEPSVELARLQRELAASNEALTNERISQANLQSERDTLQTQLAATNTKADSYQRRIEQMQREMSLETQRMAEAEQEAAVLRDKLRASASGSELTETQRQAMQRELELKDSALAEQRRMQALLAQQTRDLESQIAKAEQRKSSFEGQVVRLREQLSSANQALAESETRSSSLAKELATAQQQGESLTPELQQLQAELDQKSASLTEEKVRLARLESESASQQQLLADTLTERDQTAARLTAIESESARETARLEQMLDERKTELADIQHQLLLSKAELQMARSASDKAMSEQAQASEQAMSAQRSELEQLTAQMASQYELLQTQRAQINKLEQQTLGYENELASSKQDSAQQPSMQVAQLTNDGPAIQIIEPPVVLTRSQATVRLRTFRGERQVIGKISAPSGLLSLSVNGATPQLTENNLFRSSIPLTEAPTPVEIVLVDNTGRRAAVSFSFVDQQDGNSGQGSQPIVATTRFDQATTNTNVPLGNYYALIIGNNAYRNFSTLETAVNDAKETEKVLREKYRFKTRLLLDADRYTILAALNELRQTLGENDNLLIYYAGHGKLDESNELGYWLPVDADQDNSINWISNKAITDILNVIEAKHVLVVADSCYAGTLTQSPIARVQTDIPDDVRTEWIKIMAETRARITLTSGGVEPVLDGGGGRHSVFAKAFLDALRQNNGVMEGYSLYAKVLEVMAAQTSPLAQAQIPQYAPIHLAGHESGEFFFNPG